MPNLCTISYSQPEIMSKRDEVARRMTATSAYIKDTVISQISSSDIELLFKLYDEIFFNHQISQNFKGKLKFSLSTRLTKTAGKTLYYKNIGQSKLGEQMIEIRMGTGFFFKYNEIEGEKTVGGIATTNALQALQLVFEHELCHVIEFMSFKNSNCSQTRFKTMANNMFGHTESCHKLPTVKQIAQQKYGLKIGDMVRFNFDGRRLEGVLYNINQRATVMVRDKKGTHVDKKGNRYTKYYVPIALLSQAKTPPK